MNNKNRKQQQKQTVPNFDNVHRSIRDAYAFICVGYQMISTKDDRYGVVLLQKGVTLLGEARNSFAQANSRLLEFCLDNNFRQEHKEARHE